MRSQRSQLTDPQHNMLGTLDDVAEHVAHEYDPDEYRGISTIGFAKIESIDGRSSFVQRAKSLADNPNVTGVQRDQRMPASNGRVAPIQISVGRPTLRLAPLHDSGYTLSITNVSDFQSGPEHQRLDVQERLHELVLQRLRYHGYCDDARVHARMD